MNTSVKHALIAAALFVPVAGMAFWPAFAQPADGGDKPKPPAAQPGGEGRPARGPGGGGGGGGQGGGRSEWAEKYKDEVREHPRLGRALVALSEAKDYMEKANIDFGGTKAATIKSIDDSIKQIKDTIKHDPKREPGKGGQGGQGEGQRGRGGRGGDGQGGGSGGGGGKPSDK